MGGGGGRCRRAGADAIMAMVPRSMMMGALCLAVERRSKPVDCGRVDDEQTNSVSFDTICLAVEHRFEPVTADGLTMDRQIQLVLTQSVWPSSALPSQRSADG